MKLEVTQDIIEYLKSKDNVFEMLSNRYGLISIELDNNLFEAVIINIVGQMLSKKVADKMYDRLLSLCDGNITPNSLKKITRDEIRACGISFSKADYILEFADKFANNEYDLTSLDKLNDFETIKCLRQIKGVGKWTAEMLALFALGKQNIFSYDDVALKNGIMKSKGFKTLSQKRFEVLRKKYSPYCSFASLYFYRFNDDEEI